MEAEPVRSVQVGPLQVTLATGERGELLHLCAAPPEVRMRLKAVGALPVMGGEMIMGGFRQTILEPVRGRTLALLAGELEEAGACKALQAAAEALFALAAEGARLREGSVTLSSLVERADGRWTFDLVGAVLHGAAGEGGAVGPEVQLAGLVQVLRGQPHLARAPRLRRLAIYLAEAEEAELATLSGLLAGAHVSARSPWPVMMGAGALFLVVALSVAYFSGQHIDRVIGGGQQNWVDQRYEQVVPESDTLLNGAPFLTPVAKVEATAAEKPAGSTETAQPPAQAPAHTPTQAPAPAPAPAPTPAPAPAPARPTGPVDVVIRHNDGVAILHGWSGQPTAWIALDDLVGFLGAQQQILPSGRRQLSWQFGKVGIATVIELEMTDTNGIRYVPLTPGLQALMRLQARGWDAGSLYYDREQPV